MATVNLEQIRKKYNFKNISVATWRDPRSSTIPARGGPSAPTYSAEAIAKPYIPTYRYKYKLPEPTDDEASEDEKAAPESKEEAADPPTEAPVDSPLEPPAPQEDQTEDIPDPAPRPADPPAPSEDAPPTAADVGGDIPGTTKAAAPAPDLEPLDDPSADLDDPLAAVDGEPPSAPEPPPPTDKDSPVMEPPEADVLEPAGQDDIQLPEHVEAPWPPSPPPMEAVPNIIPEQGLAGNVLDVADPLEVPALDPIDLAVLDPLQAMPGAFDPPVLDAGPIPGSPDKSVHFAPGTPDPKPTARKKKSVKGIKSKSKKRTEVPIASLPDDILAIVDGDLQENSEASLEPPPMLSDVVVSEEPASDAVAVVYAAEAARVAEHKPEPAEPEPEIIAVDASAADVPAVQAEEVTPLAKKDSTKASSKGKDKSKKKSSKSKAKKDKEPTAATGLGIELVPSSEAPAVLDLNDLLKDLLPPPPLDGELEAPIEEPAALPSKAEPEMAAPIIASAEVDAELTVDADVVAQEVLADGENTSESSQQDDSGVKSQDSNTAETVDPVSSNEEQIAEASPEEAKEQDAEDIEAVLDAGTESVEQVAEEEDCLSEVYVAPSASTSEAEDVIIEPEEAGEDAGEQKGDIVPNELAPGHDPAEVNDGVDAALAESRSTEEPAPTSSEPETSEPQADHVDEGQPDESDNAIVDVGESREDEVSATDAVVPDQIEPGEDKQAELSPSMVDDATDVQPATEVEETVPAPSTTAPELPDESTPDVVSDEAPTEADISEDSQEIAEDEVVTNKPEVGADPGATDNAEDTEKPGETIVELSEDQPVTNQDQVLEPDLNASVTPREEPIVAEAPVSEVPIEDAVGTTVDTGAEAAQTSDQADLDQGISAPLAAVDDVPATAEVVEPVVETVGEEPPAEGQSAGTLVEPIAEASEPANVDVAPAAPPSPSLSKSSSNKQRAEHWARKPAKRPWTSDSKDIRSERPGSSKRSSKSIGEASKDKDRPKSSRSSRRYSMSAEEEAERRKRKAARKAEEAARETARIAEEERKRAHEEELRLIRHEARRAARKAAAEEAAKLVREEAEAIAREEAAARRRRREVREREATSTRPKRERRESVNSGPLLFRTTSSQPSQSRRSEARPRSSRKDDRPSSRRETSPVPRREEPVESGAPDPVAPQAGPSSSNGGSSRRRRHASETERPSTRRRDSEQRSQRPPVPEKPRNFLTSFLRSF